ncbi:MAG: crcB [Bacilli bacterium]|nr:crcB [Bacilli bacterium]
MIIAGLGGILGALSRYQLGRWITSRTASPFPIGTWIINVSGSLLLGLLFELHARTALPAGLWQLTGVGFCGAYTTFSTFGYETVQLIEQAMYKTALFYAASSALMGILAAWLGLFIAGV